MMLSDGEVAVGLILCVAMAICLALFGWGL